MEERKLISFDWAMKKILRQKANFEILEGFLSELFEFSQSQKSKLKINEVYEIFPEYYVIRVNKFTGKVKNKIDEWIYFLKNEAIKDKFEAKGLNKAKKALDILNLGELDKAVYKRRKENRMLENSLLHNAKIEGEIEGKIKGKIEGEKNKQLEIAKNLLKQNVNINIIIISTGLSQNEIQKLI